MWPIKNIQKFFMAHQYMVKIFRGPRKDRPPPAPSHPLYIRNVQSHITTCLESSKLICSHCCSSYSKFVFQQAPHSLSASCHGQVLETIIEDISGKLTLFIKYFCQWSDLKNHYWYSQWNVWMRNIIKILNFSNSLFHFYKL